MPRFVRPAFLSVRVPGRVTKTMSPLAGSGYLEADLTVRTPIGAVSRPITIRAGVYNQDGDVDATISIPRGFVVEMFGDGGKITGNGTITSITITPTNEA